MINKITGKRKGKIVLEIFGAFFIFSIFSILLLGYYGAALGGDPRIADIDKKQLQKEADLIGNPSELITEKAKSVPVLTYHVVSKDPAEDEYEISYEDFKENMFALKREGYQTVSLSDLYLFLGGEKELPDKSFVLTFDDGARAAYYNADPVLEALNYTAVMFVITGFSLEGNQSAYYLNEEELLAAQLTGRWELESHTHQSHIRLPTTASGDIAPALTNKLWIAEENRIETDEEFFLRVSTDLEKAKSLLETKFNKSVDSFALPYGDFGDYNNYEEANGIVYDLTTSMHKMVFYQFPLKNSLFKGNYPSEKKDSYLVARFASDSFHTPKDLFERIEGSRAVELPYYEDYTNYDRWPRLSGEASFKNESIILDPLENTIFAYLDGSYLWKDYYYSIQLDSSDVSEINLISRLTTSTDYIACKYSKDSIVLVQANKGIQRELGQEKTLQNVTNVTLPAGALPTGTILAMSVSGSNVKCFIDGKEVLSSEVKDIPSHGGVGIRVDGFESEDKTFAFRDISIK